MIPAHNDHIELCFPELHNVVIVGVVAEDDNGGGGGVLSEQVAQIGNQMHVHGLAFGGHLMHHQVFAVECSERRGVDLRGVSGGEEMHMVLHAELFRALQALEPHVFKVDQIICFFCHI